MTLDVALCIIRTQTVHKHKHKQVRVIGSVVQYCLCILRSTTIELNQSSQWFTVV